MNQIKIKFNLHLDGESYTKCFYYDESDISVTQNENKLCIKKIIGSDGLHLKNMNNEIEMGSEIERIEISLVNKDIGTETLVKIIAVKEGISFPIIRFYEIEHNKDLDISEEHEELHYYENIIFVN